jgi:hypothetical protein
MSNSISRSTVILRVQNSLGTLSDPTVQLADGSVAIAAFMKGGVLDAKQPQFILSRTNVTTQDQTFPAAGSGVALPRASTAIVDVFVTGTNPSCKVRPLTYNPVLNSYMAGEESDTITEPFRLLTPVFSPEDLFIMVTEISAGTIVSIAVAGV